jgi:hypothetical protein
MSDRPSQPARRRRIPRLWIALVVPTALVFVVAMYLLVLPRTLFVHIGQTGGSSSMTSVPAAVPVRLRIPAIGLDARVESVGATAQGTMGVPMDPQDVGWYAPGVRPGEPGDAVMDGFLEWSSGSAAFANLPRLRSGDEVDVDLSDGNRLTFRVYRLARFPFNASLPGLFERTGASRLSLVTSSSRWNGSTYEDRVEVDARLVSTGGSTAVPAVATPRSVSSSSAAPSNG